MKWDRLTMAQNGVTSLDDMRSHFNSFAAGGDKSTGNPPLKGLAKFGMAAAMAENPAYMQAVGWQQDSEGNYHQDPTTQGAEELRKALYEIGMNAALDLVGEGVLRAGAKAVRNSKFLDRVAEALVRQGDNLAHPRDWNAKGMANYILKGKKHPELAYKAGAYSGEDIVSTSTRGVVEESVASVPHKNDVVDAFFGKGYQIPPSNRTDIPEKMQQYIRKNYPGKDIKVFDIGDIDMPMINAEDVPRLNTKDFLSSPSVIMKEGKPIVDVGGYMGGAPKIVGNNAITTNWDIWKFKGSDLRKHNGFGIMGQVVGDFIDSRGTPLLHTWNNVYPIKHAFGGPTDPPFVKRFNEGQRRVVYDSLGKDFATHLLSYVEEDGRGIVYPIVQPVDYNNPNSPLFNYENLPLRGYYRAADNGDTLRFRTPEEADYYSRHYKDVPYRGAALNDYRNNPYLKYYPFRQQKEK